LEARRSALDDDLEEMEEDEEEGEFKVSRPPISAAVLHGVTKQCANFGTLWLQVARTDVANFLTVTCRMILKIVLQ